MAKVITKREYRRRRIRFQVAAGLYDFLATMLAFVVIVFCVYLLTALYRWVAADIPVTFRCSLTSLKKALRNELRKGTPCGTSWKELIDEINGCEKCRLCEKAHARGARRGKPERRPDVHRRGPGARRGRAGTAVCGREPGQLLDRMFTPSAWSARRCTSPTSSSAARR